MTIDVGPNLRFLGFLYLTLKFILPVLIGVGVLIGLYFGIRYILRRGGIDELWIILAVAIAGLLIIISIT